MIKNIYFMTTTVLLLSGCVISENIGKLGGTTIGVASGAVIGKAVSGKKGMLVGGLLGGAIGYLIGNEIDTRRNALVEIAKKENINVAFKDIKNNNGDIVGQAILTNDISQFNSGSSILNSNAQGYFKAFAQEYSKSKQKILIIGHTDDQGSSHSNQKLSEKRAKTIAKIFTQHGVESSAVYFYGVGESEPIATNKTSKGRGKNRRVEVLEAPTEDDLSKYAYAQPSNGKYLTAKASKNIKHSKNQRPTKIAKAPKLSQKVQELLKHQKLKDASLNSIPAQSKEKLSTNMSLIKYYGTGTANQDGVCSNQYWYKDSSKFKFNGQRLEKSSNNKLTKITGTAKIKESGFSFITEAKANNFNNAYNKTCLADSYRNKGLIKNYKTGTEVLQSKTLEHIPWLDGTVWFSNIDGNYLTITPLGIYLNGSKPSSCPEVSLINSKKQEPSYGTSTLVTSYEGENGFIYRIYPKDTAQFECIDIAFTYEENHQVQGSLYYKKNGDFYKRNITVQLVRKQSQE